MTWPDGTRLDRVDVGGLALNAAVLGSGPPVLLVHGFPQLGYAWRHVLPRLAAAGFTAIAPDLRGYGASAAPEPVAAYRSELICSDLLALASAYGSDRAVYVGHDMGGMAVWNLAACHPERTGGVAVIGTPYAMPGRAPLPEVWRTTPGVFDYQLYLQEIGPAEKELEADIERSLNLLIRCPGDGPGAMDRYADVRARGGLLVDLADAPARSALLTEADLAEYADAYRRTGFSTPLHAYRNYDAMWQWQLDHARHPIDAPAQLISPGRDPVLTEAMTAGLERVVPRLRRDRLPDCGHYVPEEQPDQLADALLDWLDEL